MKKYYLHIWSGGELSNAAIIADKKTTSPFILSDVGLEIDEWPADDFFQAWPEYFVSERLKAKLIYWQFTGITFSKVEIITKGGNFQSNYPKENLPEYWWARIEGAPGKDDFGLWKRLYLVVSEKALLFLKDNHVTHAESIEIVDEIDEFFQSDKHKFWM